MRSEGCRADDNAAAPTPPGNSFGHKNAAERDAPIPERFELPVFPLRRAAKIPTDTITLNLYEDRYLSLAERVLKDEDVRPEEKSAAGDDGREPEVAEINGETRRVGNTFGAIYCSNKPQILRGGVGPITPMMDVGDIGAVFSVLYSEEGMVPTRGGDQMRRRIKLVGVAVGRFRVERILHDGFGGDAAAGAVQPLPFILVEASRLDDEMVVEPVHRDDDELARLERELYREVLRLPNGYVDAEEDERGDISALWLPLTIFNQTESFDQLRGKFTQVQKVDMNMMKRAICSWESNIDDAKSGEIEANRQHELFSFWAASLLMSNGPVDDMMKCLTMQSTRERLDFIYQKVKKDRGGWFANVRNMF